MNKAIVMIVAQTGRRCRMNDFSIGDIVHEICSCGALEHNPAQCKACVENKSWAETEDTMEWIQAHTGPLIPYHHGKDGRVYDGMAPDGSHNHE